MSERDAVEELEATERRLLDDGRAMLGVSGRFEYGPLREALAASKLGLAPAITIAALAAVSAIALVAFWTLLGDVERSVGGFGTVLELLASVAFVGAALAGITVSSRVADRGKLAATLGLVSSAGVIAAALFTFWGLLAAVTVAAAAAGMLQALLLPLLLDWYPPEVRLRVIAFHTAGLIATTAATAGVTALAAGPLGLSWRGVLVVLGVLGVVISLAARRLRDPSSGRWDSTPLARVVRDREGGLGSASADLDEGDAALTLFEQLQRVVATPSTRPLLTGVALFGVFLVPMQQYLFLVWRDQIGAGGQARLGWLAALLTVSLIGLALLARRMEVAFRATPARLTQLLSWFGTIAAATIGFTAVSTSLVIAVPLWAIASAALAALVTGATALLLSVVHPRLRVHAAVLIGIALLAGVQLGSFLLDSFGTRFGATWGLVIGAGFALSVARGLVVLVPQVDADLDRVVTAIVEEEKLRTMVSQGRHLPLLGCRHLDFSYGQLQVLFDVDFTVDDGEMVALLGTNGAGKSTLLRVISGLGLPSSGSVHYRGTDITFVGTDRRVALGISQVPGGRAVFGPMTVAENLAVYGYSHGRDKAAVSTGIDATFDAFPRLAARRSQLASTLSGGEQQMLALGKALILRPRLLLIDELSLGLAPIVVGELLAMVRTINASGTSVVLVEQSVNIALSLVHHAYFMEKGEVRFDGPSAELLARPDLLRSVFLEGVAAAVPGAV